MKIRETGNDSSILLSINFMLPMKQFVVSLFTGIILCNTEETITGIIEL